MRVDELGVSESLYASVSAQNQHGRRLRAMDPEDHI